MAERPIRLWGAVMTEDGPVAEVRDVYGEAFKAALDDDAFRVWAMADPDHIPREDHSRGRPCVPGQPCKKCQTAALTWWWEHARRTKMRRYRAANERARKDAARAYREADHGPVRDDIAAATTDARRREWSLVRVSNGHGKTLEWIEVPRG